MNKRCSSSVVDRLSILLIVILLAFMFRLMFWRVASSYLCLHLSASLWNFLWPPVFRWRLFNFPTFKKKKIAKLIFVFFVHIVSSVNSVNWFNYFFNNESLLRVSFCSFSFQYRLLKTKNTQPMTVRRKRSVWQNPDQERTRTSTNAWIWLPCKILIRLSTVFVSFKIVIINMTLPRWQKLKKSGWLFQVRILSSWWYRNNRKFLSFITLVL